MNTTRLPLSPLAILFDVDGCLISTGGAGTKAWRRAFERLHGIPAEIGQFTEAGMTGPDVGRQTFVRLLGRDPTETEMGRLFGAYLEYLTEEVGRSAGYRVMPGVEVLLPRLIDAGLLLGFVSGALEAAAHIKLERARLNRFFSFGGYGSDSADRAELTRLAIQRCGRLHGHALNPARMLVVGDTPRDVEAGRAVGAVTVGVATGTYTVPQLEAAGADYALLTLEVPLPGIASFITASDGTRAPSPHAPPHAAGTR